MATADGAATDADLLLWLEFISDWGEACRGQISLDRALSVLAVAVGAEAAMLVRVSGAEELESRVAIGDRRVNAAVPLRESFAVAGLGEHFGSARVGTIWLQREGELNETPELLNFQSRSRFQELAVLVLAAGNTHDVIELHFRKPLSAGRKAVLTGMLSVLARSWSSRKIGLVTRATRSQVRAAPKTRLAARDLLSPSNPAGLSRAEFRVCLLLARGLAVQSVCRDLALSESTVRSHLRNIYAKSETSNMPELVYLLMSPNRSEATQMLGRIA